MTTPKLPRDSLSAPIQVLGLDSASAVRGTVTNSSGELTLPVTSAVHYISLTQPTWVKYGKTPVTAVPDTNGNTLLNAGDRVLKAPPGATHIAFIRDSSDGKISITSMV